MPGAWLELDRRERGTHFIAIAPPTLINNSKSTRMQFWSVNPYIGCEFGCRYCYARDTHRWTVERAAARPGASEALAETLTLPPAEAFERRILVKENAADVLRRTLRPERLNGEPLVIGTATDPYQPAERRFRVTRSLLETLRGFPPMRLGIITKSPLIARDADLLCELARVHRVSISLSLAAFDAALLRRLEPRTPTPQTRLRAMKKIAGRGVTIGLLIAPILPGINDGYDQLRALIAAAKDCGAAWVAGHPLHLGPATRRTLLPWMARERPALAERYQRHYGNRQYVSNRYDKALAQRLDRIKLELGIPDRVRNRDPLPTDQLELI